MDTDDVWRHVAAERRELADLLASLSPEQWDVPSLAAGWKVRHVAAHLTLPARGRSLAALAGLVRAWGNFNRFVDDDARARGRLPLEVLVAEVRAAVPSRTFPLGAKPVDPLVDVLVHGQDITVPLGIERSMPTDAVVAAAERVWTMGFPFRARRRMAGVRLRATNAPWERGEGPIVAGTIEALLLALTGRRAGLDGLSGVGMRTLAGRFG